MPNQEEVKQDSANINVAGNAQSVGANGRVPPAWCYRQAGVGTRGNAK